MEYNNMPTYTQIENAFQPAKEIDAPQRFAGRHQSIYDCYYSLMTDGSNIAIVGNRGIGKTSLAKQLIHISTGDNSLLEKIGLFNSEKFDFISMYFACGDSVDNCNDLLERLLTSKNCLGDWIYDIPKAKKEIDAYNPKFSIGVASLSGDKKTEIETNSIISKHSLDIVFSNVVSELINQNLSKHGLLIVIDEFDRIKDTSGFASFLKALATNAPKVKFCIIGVAQDLQQLIKEHESADRLFAGSIVKLPPMSEPELSEIIRVAERSIYNYITFDNDATNRMSSLAQGHPYMIHLIGKYALRDSFKNNKNLITSNDINNTLKNIAERGSDPVLESRYKKAVASSQQREIVLKSLAEKVLEDGEVWTTEAYKIALDKGVDNASQYVGQLVTDDYGAEIIKVRDRYYRFKDSLFTAYVKARPCQFVQSIEKF